MNKVYTLAKVINHKSFDGIKHFVVEVQYEGDKIPDYFNQVKEKICKKLNLTKNQVEIASLDYLSTEFIGEEKSDKETIDIDELCKEVITNIFGENAIFPVPEYHKICDIIEETAKILKGR